MSNNKQSSVEWLMEKIATKDSDSFIAMSFYIAFKEEFEQAKAMHKEEIENAYDEGWHHNNDDRYNPITYYTETFGGNNEEGKNT